MSIIPEITNIEVDGVLVKAKGLAAKTGETASMEVNFIELTKDIIKAATFGEEGTSSDATNFDVIESKSKPSDIPVHQSSALGLGEVLAIRTEPCQPYFPPPAYLPRINVPDRCLQMLCIRVVGLM